MLAVFAGLGGNFHGIPWNGPLGHDSLDLRELAAGRKNEPRLRCGGCRNAELCPSAASLWHSSALLQAWCHLLREEVLLSHCALRAVAPLPRKEGRGLHLHREGARHLHLWNSSGGELTDVNLLQMPDLLLALDLGVFFTSVLGVLKMRRRNFSDKELKISALLVS